MPGADIWSKQLLKSWAQAQPKTANFLFWYAFFLFVCKSLHLLLEYGSAAHPARVESELGLSHVFGVSTREFCQLPFRVELSKLTLWLRPGCNNGPTNWGSV